MLKQSINFLDFYSFNSLLLNKSLLNQLVRHYQDIFMNSSSWGEEYSYQEITNNLANELSDNAHLRIALLEDELIGFCWAQQLNKSEISQAISKVKYVQSLNVNNIEEVLNCFIDDGTIIYLHDLGIVESFRGKISLYQLIYPVIQSLSIKSKTQRLFFWSIENTRINNLAKFSGFNLLTTIKGMQFFMGDINNS